MRGIYAAAPRSRATGRRQSSGGFVERTSPASGDDADRLPGHPPRTAPVRVERLTVTDQRAVTGGPGEVLVTVEAVVVLPRRQALAPAGAAVGGQRQVQGPVLAALAVGDGAVAGRA